MYKNAYECHSNVHFFFFASWMYPAVSNFLCHFNFEMHQIVLIVWMWSLRLYWTYTNTLGLSIYTLLRETHTCRWVNLIFSVPVNFNYEVKIVSKRLPSICCIRYISELDFVNNNILTKLSYRGHHLWRGKESNVQVSKTSCPLFFFSLIFQYRKILESLPVYV